nr:reverse transcriptase domain-containing protein [Tanacetum cinerariifolium]
DEEKAALLKVLKSHKQAITWKISDIKGIDHRFCTHKILMEDDFKPAVQHQRRVNPKIHEVSKKEVIKLLDTGLIYLISDSPWKVYFSADFVVVDYDADPRVPLILGRPFLRTARALIDVYSEELTLRVNDEAITFKVGYTLRYSHNYYEESVNRIDVIDVTCEEYAQEVIGFSDRSTSSNPTPSNPIIASSSPSFTPFEGSDFILEEIETFLRTSDELSNLDDDYYDTEGNILYLEKLLNEDPSLNLPPMKNEDIKQVESPLMVNPKIHKVSKKEVIKLLDTGLIYLISDSPWVSPVHCVPKKVGMTVIENENNDLIPTSEELTLRVNDEAITFKVGYTSRYSYNYYEESVNRIDVIDVTCEEYAQEVIGFLDRSTSGNPTPSNPIIASSSPSFTPFEGSDFILEEIETFLRTSDELSNLDDDYYDTKGNILYLEKLSNEDPSLNLPPMKNEDLKQVDVTITKPSIEGTQNQGPAFSSRMCIFKRNR